MKFINSDQSNFSVVLDSPGSQEWRKCNAVAAIISHCPVTPSNVHSFYKSISQQLVEIVKSEIKSVNPLILRSVSLTLTELHKLQPELMMSCCFDELMAPLTRCRNIDGE